jgi:hypothetical protein
VTRRREVDRLLWELVDGTIAPDDRARLEGRLSIEPDDRARLAEMRALAQMLDSVEELPAPETLPAAVERALAASRAAVRSAPQWPRLRELFAPRWRVRLAWATVGLALGIGLGILAVADLRRSAVQDVSHYYGAMTHDRGLRLAPADGSAGLTLSRDGSALRIGVSVDRAGGMPLTLEILGNNMTFKDLQSDGRASVEVGADGERIVVTLEPASRSTLLIGTAGEDAVLVFRATADKGVLLDREVRVIDVPAW